MNNQDESWLQGEGWTSSEIRTCNHVRDCLIFSVREVFWIPLGGKKWKTWGPELMLDIKRCKANGLESVARHYQHKQLENSCRSEQNVLVKLCSTVKRRWTYKSAAGNDSDIKCSPGLPLLGKSPWWTVRYKLHWWQWLIGHGWSGAVWLLVWVWPWRLAAAAAAAAVPGMPTAAPCLAPPWLDSLSRWPRAAAD